MINDDWILFKNTLPEKGKLIIAVDDEDLEHWCFRCGCSQDSCVELRDSICGSMLMINPIKYRYEKE